MNLQNKTAVITGASDGLGREIALRLSKESVNLALIARTKEKLETVKAECLQNGAPKVDIFPVDIRNTPELKKTLSQIKTVDILINNAGIWQKKGQLDEIEESVIDNVISTNLTALIHCTQLLLPTLRKQPESAIINVSSRSGFLARESQSVYCASKWGVTGFTEVLKNDLKGTNIRVAGLYQGGVKTKIFEKADDNVSTENYTDPSDLADVVVFMLSRPPKIWLHDVRVEY